MSGGQLAVLDRAGREVKQYALAGGRATLGSGSSCDIRFMLSTVEPHHATLVVHHNKTVVHNVGGGQTLVNGAAVSVAALAHGDVLAVGGRELRWRYAHASLTPASGRGRAAARRSPHRNSAPASARQVAVVQPQRRDAADDVEDQVVANVRRRGASKTDREPSSSSKSEEAKARSKAGKTPQMIAENTTKATMWIESRKSSPRRRPARPAPAPPRRARSAPRLTKIRAPLTVDHTKQAAIMLMTGHTPKQRPRAPPRAPRAQIASARTADATPSRVAVGSDISTYSAPDTSLRSPPPPPPPPPQNTKKSALKNSSVNRSTRKIESIKFNLSNLEDGASSSADMSTASEAPEPSLRYSDSSPGSPAPAPGAPAPAPAPSRAGRILATLGATFTRETSRGASPPPPPPPAPGRSRATRGSMLVRKVLHTPDASRSAADLSRDRDTPASSKGDGEMESYSVIDLVSINSSRSVYSSASDASTSKFGSPRASSRRSTRSLTAPRPPATSTPAAAPRPPRPRSAAASRTSDCLIVSRRSNSALDMPLDATYDISGRQLDIENIPEITLNSTRNTRHRNTPPGRGIQSVTRDKDTTEFSPQSNTPPAFKGSDKSRTKSHSMLKESSENVTSSRGRGDDDTSPVSVASSLRRSQRSPRSPPDGMATPQNHNSPEEVSTPVLSIQSLLNASRNVSSSRRPRGAAARSTAGGRLSTLRKRAGLNSQSFTYGSAAAARSGNANFATSYSHRDADPHRHHGDSTPTKTVKLVYEAVKNKHSTAKRPKSIRSVIDDLNDSDIVKELFNSPVKRKLSQSMIEFGKKQLVDDESGPTRRATRNMFPSCESSPQRTPAVTPDVFVSPLSAGAGDARLLGSKLRRWRAGAADASSGRDATGSGKSRHRKSVRIDSSKVSGIKSLFARSPRNRLSDVRIKDLFAASPGNDLRRIPRLRLLFQESPENDLRDVSGVRELYRRSPADDLRDVSGVRETMRRHSPRNELDDVSGVELLLGERRDADTSFDLLMGRPPLRAYPRAKSFTAKLIQKPKTRKAHSLLNSFSVLNDDAADRLKDELRKRTHKECSSDAGESFATKSAGRTPRSDWNKSKSKANSSRELLRLATETVQGGSPLLAGRGRSAALAKTSLELKKSASEIYGEHMLPIKKRSRGGRAGRGGGSTLPIKKRAVQHSTPLRRAPARRAPRLSPIPPAPPAGLADNHLTPTIDVPEEKKQHETVQTRNANVVVDAGDINNKNLAAPKERSPRTRENITSPMRMRSTRNPRTDQNMELNNVKKRRTSLVVSKKPPGLSPQRATDQNMQPATRTGGRRKLHRVAQQASTATVAARETRAERLRNTNEANQNKIKGNRGGKANAQKHNASDEPKQSPPTTRTTRGRKAAAESAHTPKKMTRSKVLKRTVVVTKPSPTKTRAAKRSKINVSDMSPAKNVRRTRKTNTNKTEPAQTGTERARRARARARPATDKTEDKDSESLPEKRRGRTTIAQNVVQDETKATRAQKRVTRNNVNLVDSANKKSRGAAPAAIRAIEPPKRGVANKNKTENVGRGNKRKAANAAPTAPTAPRRGRPRNLGEEAGAASAPRRSDAAKRALAGSAEKTKETATQKKQAPATRKRKADDAAAAKAGPAPKTRRAAAPRAPRAATGADKK